jgi:hypothetical protein
MQALIISKDAWHVYHHEMRTYACNRDIKTALARHDEPALQYDELSN